MTEQLTTQEAQVYDLLCEGLSNPAIAEAMYVSRATVRYHLSNLYGKLGVANRAEAIALRAPKAVEAKPSTPTKGYTPAELQKAAKALIITPALKKAGITDPKAASLLLAELLANLE
jgi:DNA-binding CsgD family transcriptional regulator